MPKYYEVIFHYYFVSIIYVFDLTSFVNRIKTNVYRYLPVVFKFWYAICSIKR